MADEAKRKIADNKADELVGYMVSNGCINTATGEAWTTDELTDYRREVFTEELARLRSGEGAV